MASPVLFVLIPFILEVFLKCVDFFIVHIHLLKFNNLKLYVNGMNFLIRLPEKKFAISLGEILNVKVCKLPIFQFSFQAWR
jgi:hypothetical protein